MRTDQLVRIIVHDHADQFVRDLDPAQVASATLVEEVNGENSLTVTTAQELGKGDRLIVRDGMGTWHEYVVLGVESRHAEGGLVLHEHYCVWSLMHDLSATYVDDQFGCGVVPGHASVPQPARRALECALEGTGRWAIGTITVTAQSSASFYRRSGWDAMKTVLERWGGELRATITVSTTGVVGRAVDLLEHVGASTATRRFDYGADLTGIKRTLADEVWPCRIVPLGKSSETEAGGYTRRPGIADVNGGVPWLQDDSMVAATRLPDGSGGWEYPTSIVTNDTYEDPADLKAWALEHIGDYTTPTVTYEASVAQFAEAGLDPHGVALGDEVAIVDRTFGEGGLRLMARVTKIRRDLCDPAKAELTIGNADTSLAAQLGDISRTLAELGSQVASGSEYQSSSAYLDALVGRLNDEINATGGYWYIVPGLGTRTYDTPVSDPAVGAEASQVVEVRGGTIRIANSRDQAGNWEWRTVIVSGELIADNVRALNVNAGFISSYDGASYWDLDTGVFERNLVWEPIITETSITSSSSSETTHGTHGATAHIGKRYAIFFDSTVELGDDIRVSLSNTNNVRFASVIARRLTRVDSGTYRYVSLCLYGPDNIIDTTLYLRITTYRSSTSVPFPTYTLTNVRVYEWPSTGDGTIGFSIHSEDDTDAMTLMLSGGGLTASFNDNSATLLPGLLSLSSEDGSDTTLSLNPSKSFATISYDANDEAVRLGGSNRFVIDDSGTGLYGHFSALGSYWSTNTSAQADVFSSVSSGVSLTTVRSRRWGPFVYLYVTGSVSGSKTFTNGKWSGTQSIGTLNADFRSSHPFASGDTDSLRVIGEFVSGSYSGIAHFGIGNGVVINRLVMEGATTSSLSSFTFTLCALYMKR